MGSEICPAAAPLEAGKGEVTAQRTRGIKTKLHQKYKLVQNRTPFYPKCQQGVITMQSCSQSNLGECLVDSVWTICFRKNAT